MATLQDYLGITALRDAWPKWKANVIAINNQVINHVAGTADKHSAQDITYTGDFDGKTEVKAALDQAKTEIDAIVVNASIDPEVAFARESAVKSKVFGSLDDRLEENEQDLVSYKADYATTNINIKSAPYNAKGDDVDDTASFLALTAALNGATGVHIIIPAGIYVLSSTIIFNLTNSWITCYGTIKLKPGILTPYGLITMSGKNNRIDGLTIDGNHINAIDEEIFGSSSLLGFDQLVENYKFTNTKLINSKYSGVTFNGLAKNIVFDGMEFNDIGEHCFYISGGLNKDITFRHIRVMNYGMYQNRGQASGLVHNCYVIKSRGDVLGNNDNFLLEDITVDFDVVSLRAESVIVAYYLSNIIIERINTINIFKGISIANVTGASLGANIYINKCKTTGILHGTPPQIIHCEVHNSYIDNCYPDGLFTLSKVVNTTFNFAQGSSIQCYASFADTDKLLYEMCTFKFNDSIGRFVLNYNIPKDIVFDQCSFKSVTAVATLDAIDLGAGLTWGANQFIFSNCQCYGIFRMLFRDNSLNPNIKLSFINSAIPSPTALSNSVSTNLKLINCNNVQFSGTTADRPIATSITKGFHYYDETISKDIHWNGANWKDYAETTV